MNFTEVVNEVVTTTKRPDKITEIRRAVNAGINFSCIESDFARDFQEQTVNINGTLYAQNLPLSTFTRFRKFKYIRPTNRNKYIDPLDADKIFTDAGCEMLDKYYVTGDQVNFKLSVLASSLYIGYFAYPPTLTDTAPTFWLLDISPYMIIDYACAKIFRSVGDDPSADKHYADFKIALVSAQRDYKYGAAT